MAGSGARPRYTGAVESTGLIAAALGGLALGAILGWLAGRGARRQIEDSFRSLATSALQGSTEQFLALAEQRLGTSRVQATADLEERKTAIETLVRPLKETLATLAEDTRGLERQRVAAYSRLDTQLEQLAGAAAALEQKASALDSALRGSGQVRGRWGELQLRNVVEIAGLAEHCDFFEQAVQEEGRPDMVVRLPGGRFLAVDSRTAFPAYLEALEATSEEARRAALKRHAMTVRGRIRELAGRSYASGLAGDLDFVVLFMPGDSFLAAALGADPEIQVEALRQKVLLATPTTLVALLRIAAVSWQQNALAENAAHIGSVARTLYDRLLTLTEHLAGVGKYLGQATTAYNSTIASFESRLKPLAARLDEMKISEQSRAKVESPSRLDLVPRPVPLPFDED